MRVENCAPHGAYPPTWNPPTSDFLLSHSSIQLLFLVSGQSITRFGWQGCIAMLYHCILPITPHFLVQHAHVTGFGEHIVYCCHAILSLRTSSLHTMLNLFTWWVYCSSSFGSYHTRSHHNHRHKTNYSYHAWVHFHSSRVGGGFTQFKGIENLYQLTRRR